MFDIVGKRRWFFAFSLLITIPGLLFILLTPLTGGKAGIKFSIDYTGGTKWTIRFDDPNVTAAAVRDELVALGEADATVVKTGKGFLEIKLAKVAILQTPEPSPTPVATIPPSASPTAKPSATPAPSASPSPRASPTLSASVAPSGTGGASPSPSLTPAPTATPAPTTTPAPTATPIPTPTPSATPAPPIGNTTVPKDGELGRIATGLEAKFGAIAAQDALTSIGAVVSSDLINQALVLILVGSIGILLWITFRFRDVKFGVTALVALVHDVVVVVGVFAILGTLFDVEIDALFVTAMLTVIGFSVHDTIVVFDRIRENKARHVGEPFAEIVNHSILQTFGRSITTSFTVVLTLLALLLFGGSATSEFVLALLLGIISGTYSSIFNAAPLLVVWQDREDRQKGRLPAARPPRRVTT